MPDSSAETVRLPCRSKRQAADWSLVLISQGIESECVHTDHGWELTVDAARADQARAVLALYRRENRHWYRYFQRTPDMAGFHAGVFLWSLLLVGVHVGAGLSPTDLRAVGMTETTAVLNGQAWRLCTSLSLHADIRHLLGNLTFGTLLLGFAMARYGAGWTQLTTMLCGVAANAVSATVHGLDHRSLGASGMVMAALGMLAAGTVNLGAVGVSLRAWLFRGCLAAGLLFVLIGLDPESDVVAHAAGFASGGVAGVLVNGLPSALRTSSRANNLTALVTLTLWIAAWSAAFASF